MPLYFIRITQEHPTFRIPCLLSIASLYSFEIKFISTDLTRGVLVIELEKEEHAERLLDRGTLVMWIARLYTEAENYEELHNKLEERKELFDPDREKSWKMTVEGINNSIVNRRAKEVVNAFDLGLTGRIDLKNPEVEYVILEDYPFAAVHTHDARMARDGKFLRVYFGTRLGMSRARPLIAAHNVKTRAYFGNTSMEAEMGFLCANQGLPAPGKIVYDPFVGTGSLLYAAAHWGAYVMGSDIDGRQMRGKNKGKGIPTGIMRAATQYGVADKFLDNICFDITHSPIRRGGWIDAIITDPPYGVRAGAKRIGKTDNRKRPMRDTPYILNDGRPSHEVEGYLPPFRPYELVNLTMDLVHLARYLLVPGGRLVFFLPTVTEDWDEVDVPVVEGMREIKYGSGSVQDFGRWGRRLITIEKTAADDGEPPVFLDHLSGMGDNLPGHHNFNHRYYAGFKDKDSGESTPVTPDV